VVIVSLPALPQLPPRLDARLVPQQPATPAAPDTVTLRTAIGDITIRLQTPLPPLIKNAAITLLLPPQTRTGTTTQLLVSPSTATPLPTAQPAAPATQPALLPIQPGSVFTAFPLPASTLSSQTPRQIQNFLAPARILPAQIPPLLQSLQDDALPLLQSLVPDVDEKTLLALVKGNNFTPTFTTLAPPTQQRLLSFLSLLTAQPASVAPYAAEPQKAESPVQIRIDTVFKPTAGAETPKPPAPGLALAELIQTTPSGRPVFKTDAGVFVLDTDQQLPADTKAWVKITPLPAAQETAIRKMTHFSWPDLSSPGAIRQSKIWPALLDALDHIQQQNVTLAQTVQHSLPSPSPEKFTPAVLFFMAALRSGQIQNWLGKDTMDMIAQGKASDIASRLTKDFERLSQASRNDGGDGWKTFSLPLRHENEISQIQIFVRHPQDDDAKKDTSGAPSSKTTRFILNLNLSRMGDMQIDGYLKKRNLDVILRTTEPLTSVMRQDIARHYTDGLTQAGLQGGLSFQNRHDGWFIL
jgi:hypothetical protein